MVKVKCIRDYNDLQLKKLVTTKDDPFTVTDERAKVLEELKLVEVVEVIPEPEKEPEVEEASEPEEKTPMIKKTITKKQSKRK